jgi:hypothetical protein
MWVWSAGPEGRGLIIAIAWAARRRLLRRRLGPLERHAR